MNIKANVSSEYNQMIISVDDQFDFSLHQTFRDTYSQHAESGTEFILDLSNTTYMDSSALGMILLLKEFADSKSGSVVIRYPNESVYKVMEIAQFHRLFTIER